MPRLLPVAALFAYAVAGAALAAHEREPVLAAGDLVEPALLSGPGWRVDPEVRVRGYQARFRVRTDWGDFTADSVELLAVRVSEMPALAAVQNAEVDEVMAAAAKARALQPVQSTGAVAREPVRAAVGIPGGVARYFAERWQRLREAVRRLADRSREEVMHEGSPYDDPDGLLGAAGDDRPGRPGGFWRKRGRDLASLAKDEVGYRSARRALAARLGVDPSTRNPLLAPRLDALAWAETSGRFATAQALGVVGGPVLSAMARAVQVDQWVLQAPPAQVRRQNAQRLDPHCLDERLVRAFLRDGTYPPALQTELVDRYLAIAPGEGCEALLETALMAGDEPQARFVVHALRLLDASLAPGQRGGRFVPQGALLAYETPQGELVLPLPVDWLGWTREVDRWFDLDLLQAPGPRRLLVSGRVTPRAASELRARGWRLEQPAAYAGRPPYRAPVARLATRAG